MKKRYALIASLIVVLVIASALHTHLSQAQLTPQKAESRPGVQMVFRAVEGQKAIRIPPPAEFLRVHAQYTQFQINWLSGGHCVTWPAAAQAAFQYAAEIWAALLYSPAPVEIDACWAPMETNVLGSAGASEYYRNFIGAPYSDTWYPAALANALAGMDVHNSGAEIEANFNSQFPSWYFGLDGNTPDNQWDFVSVVLHEITHGLGFIGGMDVNAGIGYWGWYDSPDVFDRFLQNGYGQELIDTGNFANPSKALGDQLTGQGGGVFFNGPYANKANGGLRPQLYAPGTWAQGSSIYHVDDQYIETANALMTWALYDQESQHNPGPIVKGIFQDIGWSLEAPMPTPTPIPPTPTPVVKVIPASGGVITTAYQTTTTVTFPSAALSSSISVTLALTDAVFVPLDQAVVGRAFTLNAFRTSDGAPVSSFLRPVTITVYYHEADVGPIRDDTLMIYYWDNSRWITATKTCSPAATYQHNFGARFSAGVCHFTQFALLGETDRAFLPITFRNKPGP